MRKSIFELQDKSRFARRTEPSRSKARSPRKRPEAAPASRTISVIVKEYKETLAKLDDIETELSEWLASPISEGSPREGAESLVTRAVRTDLVQSSESTPELPPSFEADNR